jgi:hypothetical protein
LRDLLGIWFLLACDNQQMDAEQIVRALAAHHAPEDEAGSYDGSGVSTCALCEAPWQQGDELAWHDPGCPWRLAREWITANPG